MRRVKRVKPILLIDDIGAELDTNSRQALSRAIDKLNCQVVITAIEESVLHPFIYNNSIVMNESSYLKEHITEKYSMFHVKHGNITPVNNSVISE